LQRNTRLLANAVNQGDRGKVAKYHQRIREHLATDPKYVLAEAAFERACDAASMEDAK